MKRLIALLLALTFVVTTVGCGGTTGSTKSGGVTKSETKKEK